ncbi:MAG: 4Fe-4S dicluster domain-containing protein [Dehalococcoidia bacterium]|nr:4Fe-4S dicluster domain-containing protein [Dehalococcoidia bacterium]
MRPVYVREEVCMGCGLCEVYCALAHSISQDPIKAFKRERPRPVARIRVERTDGLFLPLQCRHCPDSPCVYACLTGAMYKDPDSGAVAVDPDKCSGCWTCIMVCPCGAITRDADMGIVAKCDLCPGRDVPACVANCPNEALAWAEDGAGVDLTEPAATAGGRTRGW